MNLPQNIHKTDGAIARSFSQELGLNLDFKTGRETLWTSSECIGRDGFLIMQNGSRLVTNDDRKIALWDIHKQTLLKIHEPISFTNTFLNHYSLHKISETELAIFGNREGFYFNIDTGEEYLLSTKSYRGGRSVIYSPLEHHIVTSASETEFNVFDISTNKELSKFSIDAEYNSNRASLLFSDDNKYLCVGPLDAKSSGIKYVMVNIYKYEHSQYVLYKEIKLDNCIKVLGFNEKRVFYSGQKGMYFFDLDKDESVFWRSEPKIRNDGFHNYYGENEICNLIPESNFPYKFYRVNSYSKETFELINSQTFEGKLIKSSISNDTLIISFETDNKDIEIRLFDMKFNQMACFKCSTDLLMLNCVDYQKKEFGFSNGVLNLDKGIFKTHFNLKEDVEINDYLDSNFLVGKKREDSVDYSVFVNRETNDSHLYRPNISGFLHLKKIEYLKDSKLWLLDYEELLILYDAQKKKVVNQLKLKEQKSYSWVDLRNCGFQVSANLSTVVALYKDKLQVLDFNTGKVLSEKDVRYSRKAYYFEEKECILLVEFDYKENPKDEKYFLKISNLDMNLNVIKSHTFDLETDSSSTERMFYLNHAKTKLIYVQNHVGIYQIDIQDYTIVKIGDFDSLSNYPKQIFSSKDNYVGIRNLTQGFRIFDTNTGKLIASFNGGKEIFSGYCTIDEEENIVLLSRTYDIKIFTLKPFNHIADMFLSPNGDFNIRVMPDQTSPNGWFYTNAPDKINVLKTKADGSEPELLPVDDEERQTFIKHHNREDIVMNRLFEPAKYEEFARLNASAQESASQDMAIELSKVEAKRLKGFD